ncbi:UNVERIFIED_CONTAM: hypothetical protein PYX00_009685 [Menopon gallinae]|uniref:Uncharacterized protein n=1 Tax=Menopon gallinae TaxID=328185 RepID=A0AAW2HD18_9NEOP
MVILESMVKEITSGHDLRNLRCCPAISVGKKPWTREAGAKKSLDMIQNYRRVPNSAADLKYQNGDRDDPSQGHGAGPTLFSSALDHSTIIIEMSTNASTSGHFCKPCKVTRGFSR